MLCYLTRMEPCYIQCIKDGPFRPKTSEGVTKPESQWTNDERRKSLYYSVLKAFLVKNKGLVSKNFDWDEEDVYNDEEMTHVKVLMALADDELAIGKNHAKNDEWIDITMRNVNILLSMDEDYDWQNYLKTDNQSEFRNSKLGGFCDEKGISQNFSSSYTPEQNGVTGRKNRTLIEVSKTMLNGLVCSKHFWTKVVRIASYTQNRSIIVKMHDKTPYEIFIERIPDISYFYMFGCPMFIHNHKDHLGKFDAKADDGYFLGYLFVSKAFRVFNTRRQQIRETYHVIFDESIKAIRFTNTLADEIRIDDSCRYPPYEFLHEDDPSRQYQANFDISYKITPHNRSLTELTKDTYVPEVITPNKKNTPLTEDVKGPLDLINTEGT
uniref:Retrovirus-related Pol polyprotein from transposon TNT 1-94 n=1 Tax=Tanacetum cinerariifolium TaxID=118510 RepID=A0A6L2K580_TANCI|nr:retrovirus-related Pol polyprotein from transposon TNT 1-94 [Tanacetum cinerariifolium]